MISARMYVGCKTRRLNVPRNALVEGFHTKKWARSLQLKLVQRKEELKVKGNTHLQLKIGERYGRKSFGLWYYIDVNRSYFSLKEYHIKRDEFCQTYKIQPSKFASGVISLTVKGILTREKNIYSIHYRLIPYMRKRVYLKYGLVLREIRHLKC